MSKRTGCCCCFNENITTGFSHLCKTTACANTAGYMLALTTAILSLARLVYEVELAVRN